ncbi:MAG TPA: hypothetical protein VFE71_06085 [Bacteroidales bacterium]|nr:hypothetical protein [Bacteroidales bacterium]
MNIEDLQKNIPAEIPAEISDQIQFFLRSYADQQMRYVIYFSENVKFEVLKKAMWFTICSEPVFYYFYKEGKKTAFWKRHDSSDSDLLIELIEVAGDPEAAINEFLTSEIPVENAFITGAISLDDNFCMAYSTFQKEITFSIGYTGGEVQQLKVNEFLQAFKMELESIN